MLINRNFHHARRANRPSPPPSPEQNRGSATGGGVKGAIYGGAAGAATAAFVLGAVAVASAANGDPVQLSDFAWGLTRAAAIAAPAGAVSGALTGAVTGPTALADQTKRNIGYASGAAGGLGAVGFLIFGTAQAAVAS